MSFTRAELLASIPSLFRFASSLVRDHGLAADLVQDTLVRALERAEQHRGEGDPGPWLRRILHNLAVDRVRGTGREVVVDEVEERWRDDSYTVDPEQVLLRAEVREELEDALAHLPFVYRATVLLHDVEGLTVREIADTQGVSLPAAKQRLRRGRMALVSALAEGHERRRALAGVPMRCWDARRHVSDYLDGTLQEEQARLVEGHLRECPTCPPLYAALARAHARLGRLRDSDSVIPPDLEVRLRALVEGHP